MLNWKGIYRPVPHHTKRLFIYFLLKYSQSFHFSRHLHFQKDPLNIMLKPTSAWPTFFALEPSKPASSILNIKLSNIQRQRSSFSSLKHSISHHTREHEGKVVRGLRGISDRLCQTLWSHGLYLDWPHQVQRSHRMIQNHPSRPLLLKFS